MSEQIDEGFDVFVHDGDKAVGAVRKAPSRERAEVVVYVEDAGEFAVPLEAVVAVEAGKVILNCNKLDYSLRRAIGHAHEHEDPRI